MLMFKLIIMKFYHFNDCFLGGLECTVCETVVQYLEALLEENSTITAIESALEKVCNFLPDKYKSEV